MAKVEFHESPPLKPRNVKDLLNSYQCLLAVNDHNNVKIGLDLGTIIESR